MAKIPIQYTGNKPRSIDNLPNGSGTVWNGHGDVQLVDASFVPALLKHAHWRIAPDDAKAPEPPVGIYGTNHPDPIVLANGSTLALRDVVMGAFNASGLAAVVWNALTDEERHAKVEAHLKPWRDVGTTGDTATTGGPPTAGTAPADLDAMDRDALAKLATARNLSFHPQLGAPKLRALISAAAG